ncbi:MAG: DUF1559 domain-containing protein [Planctomycetota bacterium]
MKSLHRNQRAFTLVELLVVIAIIGVLVALLLPGVQAAREAARRSQCQNNLKQLGLAFLNHESVHGHFPTGGWGHNFVGDPDRGAGKNQPGGWIFNVLPFIEQQQIYDLGSTDNFTAKANALADMITRPIASVSCPSRRAPQAFRACCSPRNILPNPNPEQQAKADYAANFGSAHDCTNQPGNNSGPSGHCRPCLVFTAAPAAVLQVDAGAYPEFKWPCTDEVTGISFHRSEVTIAQVSDGTSNTYAVGEKWVNPAFYTEFGDFGDDWSMYSGQQDDTHRITLFDPITLNATPPIQDREGLPGTSVWHFGSAHPSGCHMAMCDGSVQVISYDIDPQTHASLGGRNDEQVAALD